MAEVNKEEKEDMTFWLLLKLLGINTSKIPRTLTTTPTKKLNCIECDATRKKKIGLIRNWIKRKYSVYDMAA